MKLITLKAMLFTVVMAAALVAALACGRNDPASPTPDAAPTVAAQAEPATPVSDEGMASPSPETLVSDDGTAQPAANQFEASLAGDDKQKFQSLPPEFQDALRQAYDAEGASAAVQYLRGLPDDTLPIAEVLEPHALGWFDALQPQDQRYMLLEAYPAAYDHAGPEWIDFAFEFERMVGVAFDNRGVRLPPVEEALSADALAKLDALENPIMSRVFSIVWNESKPLPEDVDDAIARLQANLLAAPADLPSLEELGLSAEASRQFSELPTDMQDWLWKTVANAILSFGRQEWPYWPVEDEYIRTLSTPAAREAWDRGIWPRGVYVHGPSTFACLDGPGHWPDAVAARMPQGIEDLPVVYLPPYQDVLSPDALGRLDTLDANLKAVFENMWNWTNPVAPADVLCDITKFERGIMDIPVTSAPAAEDLLSDDGLALYRQLGDDGREWIDEGIAQALLGGLVVIRGEEGSLPQHVWSFDTPPEDFLDAVAVYVEESLEIMFAAGPGPSSRAADPPTQQEGTDDLPPAVRILPPEYHRAYRLLPTEGPWTRKYIAGFLDGFDYEEWEQLPWDDAAQGEYQPTLDDQAEVTEIIPMLRVAERDPDAEAWILAKVEAFAPEAAAQLRSVEDISARVEVFRKLVEVDGFDWEVKALSIAWGGKVAGQPDDFMARLIELQRADYEYQTDVSISWKQRLLDGNKADVCNLLLGLVLGGEYPQSVIIGGASWCDIDVAIELAEEALLANDGQPAMSEDEVREWMEFDAE